MEMIFEANSPFTAVMVDKYGDDLTFESLWLKNTSMTTAIEIMQTIADAINGHFDNCSGIIDGQLYTFYNPLDD